MINNKKLHFGIWLLAMGLLACLAVSLVQADSLVITIDNSVNTGRYTSIAVYNDLPIISYYDALNQDLRLAICLDANCQDRTLVTVDKNGNTGQYSSLVINDGQPIISYYDASHGDLKLLLCLNHLCTKTKEVKVDNSGDVGKYSSLVLNNEIPVIAYYDATHGDLKLAVCDNLSCKHPHYVTVDQTGDVGRFASLRMSTNQPIISYYDASQRDLKLALCNDLTCAAPTIRRIDQTGDVGQFSSVALHDRNPVVSYYDATVGDLKLAICHDPLCDSVTQRVIDASGDVGRYGALEVYAGRPTISYYDSDHQDLKLAVCEDVDCLSVVFFVSDSNENVGLDTDLVLNNHQVLISYHDATHQSLKLAADVLATGCYLNAPSNVNEGDRFTVVVACNRVQDRIFGFQIGHEITAGATVVLAESDHYIPGDVFAGQITLPGPNTLAVYARSLVARGREAQGTFTLGSVTYIARRPGEVTFDLTNPIFGAINGEEISGLLAPSTSATVTINDVFHATVMGQIRPETTLDFVNLGLANDPLVENVQLEIDPETGIVNFTYDNIQAPAAFLNASAVSHADCIQPLDLQDNTVIDLGDQLLLLAGDVTDDDRIDIEDTTAISVLYGQPSENEEDINHDGIVDILDLIYVSRNYNTIGPTICAQ